MEASIKKVVIAGGGTAGWVAAAALSRKLGSLLQITLIESDDIGTIGVGESTIPPVRTFHRIMGLDEQQFVTASLATFKLGISFENWGAIGDRYIHSFGTTGQESWMAGFQHFWMRAREQGLAAEYGDYCAEWVAAQEEKFATAPYSDLNYAYHLDSSLYAKLLRQFSESHGVRRIEGKISAVKQDPHNGYIRSLTLADGQTVEGDLFLDCTGFRGLLIEETLHTGFEDWGHWLLCDRAAVMQTESVGPAVPYTRAIAHDSGWRWQIPLQHRMGNGFVFSSSHLSEEVAIQRLLESVTGAAVTEPRIIRYRTGRRLKAWNKNCVALGLSTGFVEPLESTSIHLFITGVTRLLQMFPSTGINDATVAEYNRQAKREIERIRDFIILHYHVTRRSDSPFWDHCRSMEIPDSLRHRIDLFAQSADAYQEDSELFRIDSWIQVMLGQGITPKTYHPLAKTMTESELKQFLGQMRANIEQKLRNVPQHQEFINQYCKNNEIRV